MRRSLIAILLTLTGCCASLGGFCTKFGYFPEQVQAPLGKSPRYSEVRTWALRVADGYDTRHTLNRYALYGGGITALAGAGALAGLAAFSPGSAAIVGIPIGTAFLSGTMALYNNDGKALIYDRGARAIKDLVAMSDCRLWDARCSTSPWNPEELASAYEANCLFHDVDRVMRDVSELNMLLDPKNAAELLKKVGSSAEAQRAAQAAKDDAKAAQKDLEAKLDKAKTADEKNALKKQLGDATARADALEKESDDKTDALLESIHAVTRDPAELLTVRSACPIPQQCDRLTEHIVTRSVSPTTTSTSTSTSTSSTTSTSRSTSTSSSTSTSTMNTLVSSTLPH